MFRSCPFSPPSPHSHNLSPYDLARCSRLGVSPFDTVQLHQILCHTLASRCLVSESAVRVWVQPMPAELHRAASAIVPRPRRAGDFGVVAGRIHQDRDIAPPARHVPATTHSLCVVASVAAWISPSRSSTNASTCSWRCLSAAASRLQPQRHRPVPEHLRVHRS